MAMKQAPRRERRAATRAVSKNGRRDDKVKLLDEAREAAAEATMTALKDFYTPEQYQQAMQQRLNEDQKSLAELIAEWQDFIAQQKVSRDKGSAVQFDHIPALHEGGMMRCPNYQCRLDLYEDLAAQKKESIMRKKRALGAAEPTPEEESHG